MSLDLETVPETAVQGDLLEAAASPLTLSLQDFVSEFGDELLDSLIASGTDRTAIFVKDGCTACDQAVQRLQTSGVEFDVYVVGSRADDARIREWARRARIDPAKVRARHITLNHDGGRWLSLGLQGELPAVVRQVGGQWQRQ